MVDPVASLGVEGDVGVGGEAMGATPGGGSGDEAQHFLVVLALVVVGFCGVLAFS